MKKLLLLSILALPLTAGAQVTNIACVLTITEGTTRTNSYTNTFGPLSVKGLHVACGSYQLASTNNTATFRNFVRNYVSDLEELPLKDLGRSYEFQQAQIDKIQQSIQANWDNASAADRKLLTDWLAKYPVTP